MIPIGQEDIWSFFDAEVSAQKANNRVVRHGEGHSVGSYLELATKIAELQFRNRDYILLFRGQKADHQNRLKATSLKPSLFRPTSGKSITPGAAILTKRFEKLREAERILVDAYNREKLLGRERLKRHRILRWAILQHYEVCLTPLLDITHSLRIAASFASLEATPKAFVFVLGVPTLAGSVTASAEAGLQIIRLSSVCPPSAVRPHIQEGYLLGEYPEMSDFEQKSYYQNYEIDFGRRLVAKFCFDPHKFWKGGAFQKIGKNALYPDSLDPLFLLTQEVKKQVEGTP
jgi:hypothetical protein